MRERKQARHNERERMKVCAAKSMPRLAVRPSRSGRTMRCATRMSAGKNANNVPNKVAVAAAVATLTAGSPALAAVNEVGQVAGAEFLPSVLVPLVGLVFPAVAMAAAFIYLETEQIS